MGRGLAIADNRVAELNLDWDLDALEELADQGVELLDHWTEDELKEFNYHDEEFDDSSETGVDDFDEALQYKIVIVVGDESEQAKVAQTMEEMGYVCQLLIA